MFDKISNLLWQFFDVFGQLFNVVIGQILKNNLAIWSHCGFEIVATISRVRRLTRAIVKVAKVLISIDDDLNAINR